MARRFWPLPRGSAAGGLYPTLCVIRRRVLFACARRDEIRDSFTRHYTHCEKVSEHPARLNTCDTAGCAAGPRKTYATCSLGVRAVSGYFPQTRGDGVEVGSTHGRDGPPTGAGAQPLHSPKWLKTPYCNLRARYLPWVPEARRPAKALHTRADRAGINPGNIEARPSASGARRRSYTRGSEVGDRCRPSLKP
jgi:hypothetical protein